MREALPSSPSVIPGAVAQASEYEASCMYTCVESPTWLVQVRKAKKLLPWDQEWFDTQPARGRKQFDARNVPRQGGFGGGGPYQKISKNIPSEYSSCF